MSDRAQEEVLLRYGDLIHHPYHGSRTHARMSMVDRAAQFSPFAALTGHGDAIEETSRLTDAGTDLSDDCKAMLDEKLHLLQELQEQPEVEITYFEPDDRKEGGAYLTVVGRIAWVDMYRRCIVFTDGNRIAMDSIVGMESAAFSSMEF